MTVVLNLGAMPEYFLGGGGHGTTWKLSSSYTGFYICVLLHILSIVNIKSEKLKSTDGGHGNYYTSSGATEIEKVENHCTMMIIDTGKTLSRWFPNPKSQPKSGSQGSFWGSREGLNNNNNNNNDDDDDDNINNSV